MGLQANETASLKDGNPAFLVDQDIGDMTSAHWAVVQRRFVSKGGHVDCFFPNPLATGIQDGLGLTRSKQSRCACICCCRSGSSVAFH
jgi:hypothetical protein